MKATLVWISVLVLGTMVAPVVLNAQPRAVGTTFTYQGRLLDGGVPADGPYDFEFTLYDDPAAGSMVGGPISKGDEPVDYGLFTVQLDFGGGVFAGDARWLRIGVRPWNSTGAYTYLVPRQELTPVPYAMYAAAAPYVDTDTRNTLDGAYDEGGSGFGRIIDANAGAVVIQDWGGLVVDGDVEIGGRVGIGTAAGAKLDVRGNTLSPALRAEQIQPQYSAGLFQISSAANPDTALDVTTAGTGQAGSFAITASANSSAAISASTVGVGQAGLFDITSTANTNPAVEANTNGGGPAVKGKTTGLAYAALFQVQNASNNLPAVEATTIGTGGGGLFQIINANNSAPSIQAATNGSGPAIEGIASGTGRAGRFQIMNLANNSPALEAVTSGSDRAGYFQITNTSNSSPALEGTSDGSGPAVKGYAVGTGRAGFFEIDDVNNTSEAVYAVTQGTNNAGHFKILNMGNSLPALKGITNGQGGTGVQGRATDTTSTGVMTGVEGRVDNYHEQSAGVRAIGAGATPQGPNGGALNIHNGAITVSGSNRPAGTMTVTAPQTVIESCIEIPPCPDICPDHCHVIGWEDTVSLVNNLIKPDSIILLTVRASDGYRYSVHVDQQALTTATFRVMAHGGDCLGPCPPPSGDINVNYLIINPQ